VTVLEFFVPVCQRRTNVRYYGF